MSTRQTIPHGYAVVQLADKQWYPVQVTRFYDGKYPSGTISLSSCKELDQDNEVQDVAYARREDALQYVQQQALNEEGYERQNWERVTVESNVYPERCVHYVALIEEITGHVPTVRLWMHEVNIEISYYQCSCKTYHSFYWDYSQMTIEDALQRAAEYVYEHRCPCTATTTYEYEQRIAA